MLVQKCPRIRHDAHSRQCPCLPHDPPSATTSRQCNVDIRHVSRENISRDPPLTEKPEGPLSNVSPPASMSRNEVESPWGKCEADMIRGPLATRRLSLSSYFESSQSPRLTAA